MRPHDWIDQRSLALHEAVAAKLEAEPGLMRVPRENLARWLAAAPRPALVEWRRVVDNTPLAGVLDLLRSHSEHAARLRQSSPFAGVLTPEERNEIFAKYGSRRA